MLTNLLAVITSVRSKGLCVVELGNRCCKCGESVSHDLTYCNACWELSLATDDWSALTADDDADIVLPALPVAEPLSL